MPDLPFIVVNPSPTLRSRRRTRRLHLQPPLRPPGSEERGGVIPPVHGDGATVRSAARRAGFLDLPPTRPIMSALADSTNWAIPHCTNVPWPVGLNETP